MNMEERSALRRQRMQSHRAKNFAEAEEWDLRYWQQQSPEDRLSALVAAREDVKKAQEARARDVKRLREQGD